VVVSRGLAVGEHLLVSPSPQCKVIQSEILRGVKQLLGFLAGQRLRASPRKTILIAGRHGENKGVRNRYRVWDDSEGVAWVPSLFPTYQSIGQRFLPPLFSIQGSPRRNPSRMYKFVQLEDEVPRSM
jgi:hypothetical protein